MFTPKEISQFSLWKALALAATGTLTGTLEAEMLREASEANGKMPTATGFFLPFELMRRDLDVVSAAHLIGTETLATQDVLRPGSAVIRAGGQVLAATGNVGVPVVRAPGAAYWVDGVTPVTPSQVVIDSVPLGARSLAMLTTVSGQLARQVSGLDDFIKREMARTIGGALDLAILTGAGIAGEPRGIHNTPGVGTVSGAGMAWDDVLGMIESIQDANGGSVRFFGTPAVKKLLSQRERIAGGGRPIWDDGKIDGHDAFALSTAPAGILTAGDFSQVVVVVAGNGIEIDVDGYTGSRSGAISFRAWLPCDIGVLSPAAFSVATGVS